MMNKKLENPRAENVKTKRKGSKKQPVVYWKRGVEYYAAGEYLYKCKVAGDFIWFQGYEEIYCNQKKVYECCFHGGTVR